MMICKHPDVECSARSIAGGCYFDSLCLPEAYKRTRDSGIPHRGVIQWNVSRMLIQSKIKQR